MKLRNKVMLGVMAVIAITAVVLTIVGIVTHEEPTFSRPEIRWDMAPLTVKCQGYVPDADEACDTVEDVVGVVNNRLGFEMLLYGNGRNEDILVTMRAPVEVGDPTCGEPGECYVLQSREGEYVRCDVKTMNVSGGANDLEWLAVYHGLGHCMGLAHDDYRRSIMYPEQEPTPDGTIPPWISDDDREALRERYKR